MNLIDVADQGGGGLRLGRRRQGEGAGEREQRRGGQRTGGADEAAACAGEACQGRRTAGGGYGLR